MSEHTTHYDDCGCKTAELKARITELTAERDRLREERDAYKANFLRTSQDLQTERIRLKELQDAVKAVESDKAKEEKL